MCQCAAGKSGLFEYWSGLTGSEAPALGPTLVEAEFSSCLDHTHLVHKSTAIFDKGLCVSEPASYPHNFNVTVEPEQLVEDYKTLWEFVGVNQMVVGPELASPFEHDELEPTSRRRKYFQRSIAFVLLESCLFNGVGDNFDMWLYRWVNAGGEEFVNATSWHL